MSRFGSTYNGVTPGCCSQTAWVRILAAPVASGLTGTRDLTSLCLSLFNCEVEESPPLLGLLCGFNEIIHDKC